MDTEIAGTFDGSYNKLIHQEDISGDELTLYSNQEQEQGKCPTSKINCNLYFDTGTIFKNIQFIILLY